MASSVSVPISLSDEEDDDANAKKSLKAHQNENGVGNAASPHHYSIASSEIRIPSDDSEETGDKYTNSGSGKRNKTEATDQCSDSLEGGENCKLLNDVYMDNSDSKIAGHNCDIKEGVSTSDTNVLNPFVSVEGSLEISEDELVRTKDFLAEDAVSVHSVNSSSNNSNNNTNHTGEATVNLGNSVNTPQYVKENGICRLNSSLPAVASKDSGSPLNSPRKSDIINGNLIYFEEKSRTGDGKETLSVNSLQRENSDQTVDSQLQPSTPPGGCLKGGPRLAGVAHVQFETPLSTKENVGVNDFHAVENGKNGLNVKSDSSKFWSKLNADSCENTPFIGCKKVRKKRMRQPSGSSTTSIGSSSTNTSESRTTEFERRAPDGGWGWVVVFASFMVHCIADGVTMSFGVLYVNFLSYFNESKSLTSWVGSLFMAIPLLAGPLASLLTDRYGCRNVTIWGAIISCIGFFISSFANSIVVLFITVGIITGIGLAVCYVAAIVIVAFYFEKYRSLATGIAVAGSGIGTFLFAPIIQHLVELFGWRGCMIILAGIFLNMAVCGALMRDLAWTKRRDNRHSSTASSTSRQCSVTQSSDTLGTRGFVGESTTLPSIDELKRLVQSGDITSILSQENSQNCITRSESLVLLPTFLNQSLLSKEFMPYLSSNANAYEVVSYIYPHLLSRSLSRTLSQSDLLPKELVKESKSKCIQAQLSLQEQAEDKHDKALKEKQGSVDYENEEKQLLTEAPEKESLISSPWTKLDIDEARILSPKRTTKTTPRQIVPRRISASNCIGASNPPVPAAPLRDMRVPRQSMTFRGAMLNINRYRLRASSCPNIFRNSIITIAETENQSEWTYLDDFGQMLASCIDLNHCMDAAYLIFAVSNFILYVFYDTVYMYLTDYALGIGVTPEAGANLVSSIGILNCVGMVVMGYIGDQSWSSPMLIYNVSMVACGLSVIAMPFIDNYWLLAAASAMFGLFISANYALTAVILVELISLEAFSKSYGLLLLIQGVANLIGPPLVGFMADATGDYLLPFVVSGVFIVICGLMLSFIPLIQRCKGRYSQTSTPHSSPRRSPSQKSSQFNKTSPNAISV